MDFQAHPILQLLPLSAVGFVAGFLNVFAGGGSLITLPVLLWLGFPAPVANASNRIGLVAQNIAASTAFHRGGLLPVALVARLVLVALPGVALGAFVAIDVDERLFRRVLAGVLLFTLWTLLRGGFRPPRGPRLSRRRRVVLYGSFFVMGFYAGFIQAGLGFLLIAVLSGIGGLDMVRTNAVKVAFVLLVQALALTIFALAGTVDWAAGAGLAMGGTLGAWTAAHWQMAKGSPWVRRVVIALLALFTARLVYEGFLV